MRIDWMKYCLLVSHDLETRKSDANERRNLMTRKELKRRKYDARKNRWNWRGEDKWKNRSDWSRHANSNAKKNWKVSWLTLRWCVEHLGQFKEEEIYSPSRDDLAKPPTSSSFSVCDWMTDRACVLLICRFHWTLVHLLAARKPQAVTPRIRQRQSLAQSTKRLTKKGKRNGINSHCTFFFFFLLSCLLLEN